MRYVVCPKIIYQLKVYWLHDIWVNFTLAKQVSKNCQFSVACAAGSYRSGDDMVTCKKCEGNKISSKVGGTSCEDCPNGNEANNDKTKCGTSYLLIYRK